MSKWKHEMYGSGTQVVVYKQGNEPYYYIYGEDDNHRSMLCKDILDWCNGGERPAWFNDLCRSGDENTVVGHSDVKIFTTGPNVLPPNDNGRMAWRRCKLDDSIAKRKGLIDAMLDSSSPLPSDVIERGR